MADQPTPAEIAEYEAQASATPAAVNPLHDLSTEDIAELAIKDKTHFSIPDEFARQKDFHSDPAFVQKVADALNIVNQRGFKAEDLPSIGEAAKAVGTAVKGLGGQIWNYANVAGNLAAGAVSELIGAEGLASGYAENISQRLGENIAGTEEAMTGLSQLAQKGARKAGQAAGLTKEFSELTPAERVTELFNKAGEAEVREERLKGKGEFSKAVTGSEAELDPEKVGELAAGDPFSFYLFGGASNLAGKAIKVATPAAVSGAFGRAAGAVERAAETAIPKVVGGGITAAGETAKAAATTVEKTAPLAGAVAGGVAGGAQFGPVGAIGGVGAGFRSGQALARGARAVKPVAEKIADLGRQVSGSVPIQSAYAQAGRDVLQALPGAAGEFAKGTALDIGLAAATAEVPQDTAGAVGFGAALGALSGAGRIAGRTLSGQLIAPRSYGVNRVLPSSGQFKGFDAMHADAMRAATPGVRARLNALREFAGGVAPGTDVFLGRDAASVERALIDAGVNPETAKSWSEAEGFFTADLPGKDGKPRRVIVATNVDSVPHEAQHAIQDVLGEEANQKVDAIIKEAYAPAWEAEGQKYADRLAGGGDPRSWREVVLDESGWGLAEAKEKIYRDIFNQFSADGQTPAPKLVEEMAKAELGRRMDEAVERGQPVDPNEIGRRVWRDVFEDAPEEVARISDKYIAREIAAENFDALFKNQGPRLEEGTQVPQRLARILGGVVSALGGEPLAGRTSEIGGVALRTPVIEAVRSSALGRLGERPTVAPREPPAAAPRGVPSEPIQQAADEARTIAAEAPEQPLAGGTRSPRELLGQIAEAISAQEGVKLNYLSAPGEPAAATSSNRNVRRAVIESFRNMPPEARALWEKTFFPERVIHTRNGKYQVQGWAPEVFASNAHKMARFMADTPAAQSLSPYAIDVAAKTFTPEAWQALYADTQIFVQNQMRGMTGSGEPLVVPRSVTEAGGFAPPTRPGAIALEQGKADFINMLFGFKLPETPRVQAGRRPLNVVGQEVSAATIPGRVEVPVRPRGEFTGLEAELQGIEGTNIAEVNPLRNQIESAALAAGKAPPSLIEAIQKLNLENIKEIEGAPEQPQFRGNTLSLTAGFQPARAGEREWRVSGQVRGSRKEITVNATDMAEARKQAQAQGMHVTRVEQADKMATAMFQPAARSAAATAAGERLARERGFEIRHTGTPANPGVEIFRNGAPVGDISAVRNSPTEADIASILVRPEFRGQGISEILYREMGKRLQDEGVENVTGMIIDKRALAGRKRIFPETEVENEISVGDRTSFQVNSRISPTAQFSGKLPTPKEIAALDTDAFAKATNEFTGRYGSGLTALASELGASVKDAAGVADLRSHLAQAEQSTAAARAARDIDAMYLAGNKTQFFREALQVATGEGPSEAFIQKTFDPNFKSPMKAGGEPTVQMAPKSTAAVKELADEYAKSRGLELSTTRKYAAAPEPLLKEIADFYQKAKDAPDDPAVQSSYDALTKETADQYQAIVDSGYTIEPWRDEGQPYPNSDAAIADVRDNKHLYYFPSEKGFGSEGTEKPANRMLQDSGVVIDGESVPYNDLFRAVHDFFGHAKEGYQFGPRDEFNAWGAHSEMFSPEAQGALAAETLAQNAFVNFGPHMRTEAGAIRKQGEEGYLGIAERPFAEQKNVVVPQELIDQARAQFAGKKKKAEDKYALKPPSAGFSKAWVLPSGEPVQLGGTWHHKWLSDNPDVAAKYKLNVPEFTGGDAEGVREQALKAGFARVNHSQNSGTLTVEARARDWRKIKPAIERLVESNLDNIDNMTVHLMDEAAARTVDSLTSKLFNYDDAEKLQHLPFITEGEIRGQFAPKKNPAEVRRALAREVEEAAARFPEALPLEYRKGPNGAYRLDSKNQPIPVSKEYRLTETPLAKAAATGIDTPEGQETAMARAYADKLKEAYAEAAKDPTVMAGKDWYSLTRTKLQSLFGADTKFFAELLGATSAQTDVASNYRYAIDAYNRFKSGAFDDIVQKYREGKQMWESGDISAARALDTEGVLGENPTRAAFRKFWIEKHNLKPTRSNGKLFGANSDAVLRVLDGSWREEVQGPKTPNFADNLSGDSFEATIDIWAARLMRRLGYEGTAQPWRILPKNETGVTDKDFFLAQKAFRLAGDELGVSPDSLQAIVWFLEKGHWDQNGWTKNAGALKSDFNTFLDVTERTPEGVFRIAEVEPKPKVDVNQPELQFQPVAVEPRTTPGLSTPVTAPVIQPEDAEKIANAIYRAEGGTKAKKPYGILSVSVKDEAEARRVALNTIRNNWKRWQAAGKPGDYLEFLARRYAPIGAENDPKALNQNWLKNVRAIVNKPLTTTKK